jgi:hypothetical protein
MVVKRMVLEEAEILVRQVSSQYWCDKTVVSVLVRQDGSVSIGAIRR